MYFIINWNKEHFSSIFVQEYEDHKIKTKTLVMKIFGYDGPIFVVRIVFEVFQLFSISLLNIIL